MEYLESQRFPATIPFGQEITAKFLNDGKPMDLRMMVVRDCGASLEAEIIIENDVGEVLSLGGTIGRGQIKSVGDSWTLERAIQAHARGYVENVEITEEMLEKFTDWWERNTST